MLEKHPKLLDKQQTCFRDLRGTCDTVYRNLRCQGIGAEVRHAPIITPAEEEKLWLTAVLNINNPRSLQRAVFYYIGKCFCIRGGQEQRNLGPSNFKWSSKPGCDPHCVTYIEHGSKNRSGASGEQGSNVSLCPRRSPKVLSLSPSSLHVQASQVCY